MSPAGERQPEDTVPDERQLPRAPVENSRDSSLESLCEGCKAVDWDQVSKLALASRSDIKVIIQHASVNKSHAELRRSSCQVCQLLSAIKPVFLDTKDCVLMATSMAAFNSSSDELRRRCTVVGFRLRSFLERREPFRKTGCLAVLGSDLDDLKVVLDDIQPNSIDYRLFQALMNQCDTERYPFHLRCKVQFDAGDIGLNVIDIWSRKVVRAHDQCRYIALSYVWGSAGNVSSDGDLNSAPLVIQDAISVTASIGCQYLWVDRYCIPQNSSEKHRMISNMDKVYSSAFLTIIAAAGSDAQSGLPGVSRCQRKSPKSLRLDKTVRMQQLYPHPIHHLEATPWASRAWTYQEGFLSRWRLIFTTERVLFLCNDMCFVESVEFPVEFPMDYFETQKASVFKHMIGSARKRPSDRMTGLRDQIHEYSGRTLSYDTDSLDAFLGVLNYHTTNSLKSNPISHVWGVPFVVYNKGQGVFEDWDPQVPSSSEFHLFWIHEKPARRRDGFPSWSWTGWAGLVSFPTWSACYSSSEPPSDLEESSEDRSSRTDAQFYVKDTSEEDTDHKMTLVELFRDLILSRQSNHEIDQNLYRRLLVSCMVRPLQLVNAELSGAQANSKTLVRFLSYSEDTHRHQLRKCYIPRSSGRYALFRFQKSGYVGVKVYWDELCDGHEVSCLLVYHQQHASSTGVKCAFLLAKRVDGDQYQRVGIVSVDLEMPLSDEGTIFMDEHGQVLDEVDLFSDSDETLLLSDGERRNIYLI